MDQRPYDKVLGSGVGKKRGQDDLSEARDISSIQAPPQETPFVSPADNSAMPVQGSAIPIDNPQAPLQAHAKSAFSNDSSISPTTVPSHECPSSDSPETTGHQRKKPKGQTAADVGQRPGDETLQDRDKIDEYRMKLGAGWNSPETNGPGQQAMKGYETYIRRQYPLDDPQIRAFHSEHFLVEEAGQGWFLFNSDLQTGQMLAADQGTAFKYLNAPLTHYSSPLMYSKETIQSASGPSATDPTAASEPQRETTSQDSGERPMFEMDEDRMDTN